MFLASETQARIVGAEPMEVNEEIIEQYLKLVKGWFYIRDISFPVSRNYSNIDLLAFDPKRGRYYDIEVKYRSRFTLAASSRHGRDISFKSVSALADQFTSRPTREATIRNYTNGRSACKILVTTHRLLGQSPEKRKRMEKALSATLAKRGYRNTQVWYFDDIIPSLVRNLNVRGRYNTQLLQAIRMIKDFMLNRTE